MRKNHILICFLLLSFLLLLQSANATTDAIEIRVNEVVNETVAFNGSIEKNTGTSSSGVALAPTNYSCTINITNPSSETVSDINITLTNTDNLTGPPTIDSEPAYTSTSITGTPPADVLIYIRELHAGDKINLLCDIDDSVVGEPLNITENYSATKVIANRTFNITMNITNEITQTITNINVTKTAKGFSNMSGGTVYFQFESLVDDDSGNATLQDNGGAYDADVIWWSPSGGSLTPGSWATITFTVRAPFDISTDWPNETWGDYFNVGNASISFNMSTPISGLTASTVTAIGQASAGVSKERINTTHWKLQPYFNDTSSEIDYNLTAVRIWATNFSDYNPGNDSITDSEAVWQQNREIANGTGWENTTGSTFAYDSIPVAWIDVNFTIWDNDTTGLSGQIDRIYRSTEQAGNYLFIEDIYVMSGYFVKVTKSVEYYGTSNIYNVTIVIENIGTTNTPDWITMYDLIAPNFNVTGDTNNDPTDEGEIDTYPAGKERAQTDHGILASGSYSGYHAYVIDFRGLNASSNGNGLYDSASGNEIMINYTITGTGLYSVENAFIVGIDPIRIEGANPEIAPAATLGLRGKDSPEQKIAGVSVLLASVGIIVSGIFIRRT